MSIVLWVDIKEKPIRTIPLKDFGFILMWDWIKGMIFFITVTTVEAEIKDQSI